MSIRIMASVWADTTIKSRTELLILLALADFANDEGYCWPSIETISAKSRTQQRAVQDRLCELKEAGRIEMEISKGPRGTNLYRVIVGGVHLLRGASTEEIIPGKIPGKIPAVDAPDPSGTPKKRQEASLPPSTPPTEPPSETETRAGRLSEVFRRRPGTKWSDNELRAFRGHAARCHPDEFDLVIEYYKSDAPYKRHDLQTLLNNFTGEIDRARAWRENPIGNRRSAPPPVADSFWKDKARMEMVESSIKAIEARASHTAMDVIIQPQDKEKYRALKTELRELRKKMGL